MAKFLAFILIATLVQTSVAQQATTLSKEAAAIKRKADQLSPQARISVVQFHAPEEFGSFVSNDQEGLTFYDVDRKTNITVKYTEVRKLKDGYGGYNSLRHTHTDHTKAIVAILIVTGLLVGVIVAAAASK